MKSFKDLDCSKISDMKGIYKVYIPEQFCVKILDTTTAIKEFKGQNLLYPAHELKTKFDKTDKKIIYIGKALKLQKRITQFLNYGYGKADNHRGGRAIWQIEDNKNLQIGYFICENPDKKEHELLSEYYNQHGILPLANWNC